MSELGVKSKLKIGQFGYSLDIISNEKRGRFYFDGVRYDVKAGGDIRKWAEVLVITLTPEPTVIETWSVFPLSYLTSSGGFTTVGVDNPLPVTAGTKAITYTSLTVTAAGTTALVTPTSATKKIRVQYFSYGNAGALLSDCALTFDSIGAVANLHHRFPLAANGGAVNANLIDANWEGTAGQILYACLQAGNAAGVNITIGYTEV